MAGVFFCICLAPGDFNVNRPLADRFMIEIGRWPRGGAPLASHIEVFRRKIEMWVLNRCVFFIQTCVGIEQLHLGYGVTANMCS